jgi:hypothetical protein
MWVPHVSRSLRDMGTGSGLLKKPILRGAALSALRFATGYEQGFSP